MFWDTLYIYIYIAQRGMAPNLADVDRTALEDLFKTLYHFVGKDGHFGTLDITWIDMD